MADAWLAAKVLKFASGTKNPGDDVTTDVASVTTRQAMLQGGEIVFCPSAEISATATKIQAATGAFEPEVSFAPYHVYTPENGHRKRHRAEGYNASRRASA